jgi:LPS sulfotransferase NodH
MLKGLDDCMASDEAHTVCVGQRSTRRHFVMRMYDREMDFMTYRARPGCRYILATMPRSGSTLCSIRLWQSGQLGAPLEYLNFRMATRLLERLGYGVDEDGRPKDANQLVGYWKNLQQLRTSPNGVFGCKVFVSNLMVLANRYPEFVSRIAPTHVVYLTRMDLVGQAISYYRAQRSSAWFGGVQAKQAVEYDFKRIQSCLVSICTQTAVWERLFETWGVMPLRVSYEQMCRQPRAVTSVVKTHLGIAHDPAARLSVPLIVKQADHTSEAWRARFKEDALRKREAIAA